METEAVTTQTLLDEIDRTVDQATGRLLEFLRIPSVSTDPAHHRDCGRAADWLANQLRDIGFESSVQPTEGLPAVVAVGPSENSTTLFYGHYDVQPTDPLDKWDHSPFEPIIEDRAGGRVIRGRGASDDKGQLMTFVEACRAYRNVTGTLPRGVRFFFEGEEESGSPSLVPFLEKNRSHLSSSIALICDTGLFDHDTPAIVTMLRGLLAEEVTVSGPELDLHSGIYGGAAANPLRILSHILAQLHDHQGRVTVPGFYQNIPELPDDLRAQWKKLDMRSQSLLTSVGLAHPAGEIDRSLLEMVWSRPTCEINGITGGYGGDGFKTVIPATATAKISFRLVEGQDPATIRRQFRTFVQSQVPADCSVAFGEYGASPACRFSLDHPLFDHVRAALSAEWPEEPVMVGCGGSIPVAGYFKSILGIDSVLTGFGLEGDQIHSPNEKYDIRSFHRGMRTWARVLSNR